MTYYLIYKITNRVNGKIYIGQHRTEDLNDGYMGSGQNIKRAINKYGVENFTKEILYFCTDWETMNNMEEVIVSEDFVKREDTYNLRLGGSRGSFSEESRKKMSQSGKTRKPPSESTRAKLSEKSKLMWKDENIRKKIVGKNTGQKRAEETRRKLSEALKGKHPTEESKRKNAEAHIGKGHRQTDDTRRRISQSKRGVCTRNKDYRHSQETRSKIGIAQTGKHWYTNGYANVFDYECPEGYVNGMTRRIKMKQP